MRVRPPTRPMYIRKMSTPRETRPRLGVSPRERPTVPTAEAVSNRQSAKGSPSTELMMKPPKKNRVR